MKAEIDSEFDAEVLLKAFELGSFDVLADGRLLFSKGTTHRFPEPGEIAELVRRHSSSGGL